jgi:hypothetical protein
MRLPFSKHRPRPSGAVALAALLLTGCAGPTATRPPARATAPAAGAPTLDPGARLAAPPGGTAAPVPALATREAAWATVLTGEVPILPLPGPLGQSEAAAQALALASADLRRASQDPNTGQPQRSEVMQLRPLLAADKSGAAAACGDGCYRVEVYNYATNATTSATVDVPGRRVVAVETAANTQPEVPAHLGQLAAEIASRSSEVAEALGLAPDAAAAGMPNVKTALNGSRCERSRHLCVAPTFIQGDRALWAIVDLTDGRLVGVRWTELGRGAGGAAAVTEQSLEDEVVMSRYCEKENTVERGPWRMTYVLTPSDGLELRDLRYRDRQVLRSAKLVDWHVSYSGSDGFGYSDAIGCPKFSTASVVAFDGPTTQAAAPDGGVGGFTLTQDFRSELWPLPCNYRYQQNYTFYDDGRFRVGGANLGRGCGNEGTYRPVVRLDLTAGGDGTADRVEEWDGTGWRAWSEEGWRRQGPDTAYSPEGYELRVLDAAGQGLAMAPNRGELPDGRAGDNAFVYLTRAKPEEGEGDLLTLGACCNTDQRQGPEAFTEPPEPVTGTDVVLWYVPQLKNSDKPGEEYCWVETELVDGRAVPKVSPCAFGALFVPLDAGG